MTRGNAPAPARPKRLHRRKACAGCTAGLNPFTPAHFKAWAGQITLDDGEKWIPQKFQLDFLADVFAGTTSSWLVIPQGNGKTALMAGLALYHLEHRANAYVPVAAASSRQAETLFNFAAGMLATSARLGKIFEAQGGNRLIRHRENPLIKIKIYAADDDTGDSVAYTLAVVDELHRHKRGLTLWRLWRGKATKRAGGQIVGMSTAGEPGGDFEETRDKWRMDATARRTRGAFTRSAGDGYVMHEWSLKPEDDVEDLELVKTANPFSGITLDDLAEERSEPTTTIAHWKRFRCNIASREAGQAISAAEWDAAKITDWAPRSVWVGIDGAWSLDTFAIVPFWTAERAFGPATVLVPPKDGSISPNDVKAAIRRIHEATPIERAVADPTFIREIIAWLRDELGIEVVERTPTAPHNAEDYALFVEALAAGRLHHSGDPVLTRHVLNAIAKTDGERVAFQRPKWGRSVSGTVAQARYIDALDAAAMVHSEFVRPQTDRPKTQRWGAAFPEAAE